MATIALEKLTKYSPIIDAFKQGKTIERKTSLDRWIKVKSIDTDYLPEEYRIQKEDEYIPWTALIAPLAGVSFMRKGDVVEKFICVAVTEDGYIHSNGIGIYTFQEMFDKYLYCKVGTTEWLPCGTKV